MVNTAIFRGRREEFLLGELPKYLSAISNGTKEEFLKNVLRRYFKRFPPHHPHTYEPTEAELQEVDDTAPDYEPEQPDPFAMGQEAYYAAMKQIDDRQKEVEVRTGQILRWFTYRQSKSTAFKDPKKIKDSDLKDPMFIMTCRLLGKAAQKPRQPIAYNLWCADNPTRVQQVLSEIPNLANGRNNAGADVKAKKKLFESQPKETQQLYKKKAEEHHKLQLEEWNLNLTRPASKDPEARQVCIDNTAGFAQPLLNLITEFTGMNCLLLVGGPEPAAQKMNIIGVHSGFTKGPVKMNFAEAESKKFHEQVIPAFSDFLRKCFSPADVKAAILPIETTPLLSITDPNDITYCTVSGDDYSVP
ncbi:hypothetical protein CVT26_000160, partial [Gymnopilus dilepis]